MSTERGTRVWAIIAGVGAGLVGLAPWLVSGAVLPLQNLSSQDHQPFALLPFSQYYVTQIAAMFIIGGAVAGLLARFALRSAAWWVVLGLAGIQVLAIAQAALAAGLTLRGGAESLIYLGVLGVMFLFFTLFASGVSALIAVARPAGRLLGLALGIVMIEAWLGAWKTFLDPAHLNAFDPTVVASIVMSVLIALVITIIGIDTIGRIVAALAAVALLWVTPAVLGATMYTLGSRAELRDPAEAISGGLSVFWQMLALYEVLLPPVVVAVVLAVVGLVIRQAVRSRR